MTLRAQKKLAVETNRQTFAPILNTDIFNRRGRPADTGIVDQDVDAIPGNGSEPGINLFGIGHIDPGAVDVFGQRRDCGRIDIADKHICAFAG